MVIRPLYFSLLFLVFILSGCGGEESASTVDRDPEISADTSGIYLEDISRNVSEESLSYISVLSGAQVANGKSIYVTEVTPIGDNIDPQCYDISVSEKGFSLASRSPSSCVYQYQVAYKSNTSLASASELVRSSNIETATAIAFVAIQPSMITVSSTLTTLTPLSVTLQEGHDTKVIDVKTALGTNFPTDATMNSSTTVLGNGSATLDTATYKISFSGGARGITRIVYLLTGTGNSDAGVIYMGTIDVAISAPINQAPTFKNFTFQKATGDDLLIREGEKVTIDVTDAVTDNTGASELQIVHLNAYNASVSVVSTTDLTNKKFTFTAQQSGTYHVAVTVSDHNGGYAVGLVEVEVQGAFSPIVVGTDVFMPTISLGQASYLEVDYIGLYTEVAATGPEGSRLPLMSYAVADALCKVKGGSLPTKTQMDSFKAQEQMKLWVSGDTTKQQWPIGKAYYTSSLISETNSVQMLTFSSTGTTAATYQDVNIDTGLGYVMCIDRTPQRLVIDNTLIPIVPENPTPVKLTASFITLAGSVYPYVKALTWSTVTPTYASIDGDMALGLVKGTATITATTFDGQLSITKDIPVTDNILLTATEPNVSFEDGNFEGLHYYNKSRWTGRGLDANSDRNYYFTTQVKTTDGTPTKPDTVRPLYGHVVLGFSGLNTTAIPSPQNIRIRFWTKNSDFYFTFTRNSDDDGNQWGMQLFVGVRDDTCYSYSGVEDCSIQVVNTDGNWTEYEVIGTLSKRPFGDFIGVGLVSNFSPLNTWQTRTIDDIRVYIW